MGRCFIQGIILKPSNISGFAYRYDSHPKARWMMEKGFIFPSMLIRGCDCFNLQLRRALTQQIFAAQIEPERQL